MPPSSGAGTPRMLIMDPSAMKHLARANMSKIFTGNNVVEQLRKPFHSEAIVFPMVVHNNHWVLLVCHTRNKRVVVMDSLPGTDGQRKADVWPAFFNNCIQPLQRHFGEELDQLQDWSIEISRRSIQQKDGHSCGLHMLSTLHDIVVRGYIPFALGTRRGCS
jgi:hypothetical protein